MTAEPVKITLLDLDNADVQDITRELEGQAPGLLPESVPGNRYGEPATILLAIVVAQPVILALAAWVSSDAGSRRSRYAPGCTAPKLGVVR